MDDRGWNPNGPIRWEASAEDRSIVFLVGGEPLLRLRRKGRSWIFEATGRAYEAVELAAEGAEIWLYNVLGNSERWADPSKLELLREYVDFLTIKEDEPRRMRRRFEPKATAPDAPERPGV